MGTEIERKFLVISDRWRPGSTGLRYVQGYLSTVPERTVRVRRIGDTGMLTIKGKAMAAVRSEFEYEVPVADALALLDMCEQPLISKTRHRVPHEGRTWEVDVFDGDNAGLVVAEIELSSPNERVPLPPWVGEEVTDDPRYLNANLVARPFRTW